MWFRRFFVQEKEKEGGGGGGSGGTGGTNGADDAKKELEALKTQNSDLMKRLEALEVKNKSKNDDKGEDDDDLATKARKQREQNEDSSKKEKSLEAAINFNVAGKDFLKSNQGLLPKTIEGLFTEADKEKYDTAVEKANAIKSGIISEFFAVQSNHDLLTGSQKIQVDEFLKLTKNGKQERVESIYSMIFEPTLESLKRIEKAKQVNMAGKDQSSAEKALTDRLQKMSRKHYLGEKDA